MALNAGARPWLPVSWPWWLPGLALRWNHLPGWIIPIPVMLGPMLSHVRDCPDTSTILKVRGSGEAPQHVRAVLGSRRT